MTLLSEWTTRLRHLWSRTRFDRDLEAEMAFHIEAHVEELEARGISREEALASARREFGSVIRMREGSREAWRFTWLEDLAADLRYALRALRRSPAFALTAVCSLALGIGANSTVFSALDSVLWRPLPVADPQSLVNLSLVRADGLHDALPGALVERMRESDVFAALITTRADGLSFSLDDRAERIVGEMVSPNYFAALGVRPVVGQGFTADVQGGRWAPEAVLSYTFWQRRFNGDPQIVGRMIRLNSYPFTVVGVSPPSFVGVTRGSDFELRIPILPSGQELAQIHEISGSLQRGRFTIARLKPGGQVAQVEAAANSVVADFVRTTSIPRFRNAGSPAGSLHLRLSPGARGDAGDLRGFRTPLYVLLVLVALVLLIACANVASLLLARATTRTRELAVRASIGAGRFRLIRQMVTESVLLSLIGGLVGLVVAWWAAGLLIRFLPQGHIRIAVDLQPDRRALFFTFGVSLVSGLLLGIATAWHATRGDLAASLKSDSAGSIGGRRIASIRRALLASQIAFSLVLLAAAGTFVRALSDLRPIDYGARPERILLFTMKPQQEIYTEEHRRVLAADLLRRVSGLVGVQAAALAENGPLGSRTDYAPVATPDHAPIDAAWDTVTRDFFETVGIPLKAGRVFGATDDQHAALVAVVNESLVRALFPSMNPLGRRLTLVGDARRREFEIVGVAADTHYYDVHGTPQPVVWLSMGQLPPYMPTLHVRTTAADTAAMTDAIRREFDAVDKGFPVFNIRTLEQRIDDSLSRERLVASLSAVFGLMALALVAVGMYGILAYAVARRTREIGIRIAIGSSRSSVLTMVAREALGVVSVGMLAGVGLTIAASRVLSWSLVADTPITLGIVVGCALAILLVTAMAISIPAGRACRVDPVIALRCE